MTFYDKLVRRCCRFVIGDKVECSFEMSNVVSTLLLVWMGLSATGLVREVEILLLP